MMVTCPFSLRLTRLSAAAASAALFVLSCFYISSQSSKALCPLSTMAISHTTRTMRSAWLGCLAALAMPMQSGVIADCSWAQAERPATQVASSPEPVTSCCAASAQKPACCRAGVPRSTCCEAEAAAVRGCQLSGKATTRGQGANCRCGDDCRCIACNCNHSSSQPVAPLPNESRSKTPSGLAAMPPGAVGSSLPVGQDRGCFVESAGTFSQSGAHVCVLLCRFML